MAVLFGIGFGSFRHASPPQVNSSRGPLHRSGTKFVAL
jgi:hypothetical protein